MFLAVPSSRRLDFAHESSFRRPGRTALAITVSQASTIIAPSDDPLVTAQMYRDEAALYATVGKVTGSGLSGSGVLISDRWVLTAGHIAFGKTSGTFNVGGVHYAIQSSVIHPSYSFGSNPYDLGLLYLSGPVAVVDPAKMIQLGGANSILGREATWVGTGLTGTGLTGAQAPLEFRAFTNVIDVIGTEYGLTETSFVADFDRPDGSTNADPLLSSPTATRLEGNVATGDSGGGVFVTEGGIHYLVGNQQLHRTLRTGRGLQLRQHQRGDQSGIIPLLDL